jgi:uncharacterized protein (DUF362 family)
MTTENFIRGIDRRTFLKIVSITGAAGLIYPARLLSGIGPLDLSRVVLIEDAAATSGTTVDANIAQSMVNCGIMHLAQEFDVGEAWKALVPGVSETSVIAIKVNCINSSMPTHPEVAYAVANSLGQMDFGGTPFPENNIIIFDRTNNELTWSGYTLNTSGTGIRCFGTNQSGVGYSTETYDVNGSTQRLSTVVTELADYMINLSVLKNHGTAGITLCLKNHYGTCNSPGSLHGNDCDPYIPELNALAPIRDKQMVHICDALLGIYSGGPSGSPQFTANTLIMSRDIVTVDYQGREILEANGCTTIGRSHHVETAAGAPYNLGTNDPAQMDVVTVTEPAGAGDTTGLSSVMLQQNHPNPFSAATSIRFYLPDAETVSMTVYDASGRRVRRLIESNIDAGWHDVPWAGETDGGRRAASGVYFCRLETDGYKKSVIMQLVR